MIATGPELLSAREEAVIHYSHWRLLEAREAGTGHHRGAERRALSQAYGVS